MSYLDKDGVLYFWQKIKSIFATQTDLSGKVDKVSGKGLSTNDYTTAEKNKLAAFGAASTYATQTDLSGKVDKVTGKGLSTNDYTTAEKEKLNAFGAASTYATQTDLNGKVDKVSGKGLSTNDYTTAEKNKLAAFGAASTYALKTDITGMYKYKGSVASVSALPSTGNTAGDVYNVEASGMNYAWDGEAWDALGEIFTIMAVTNAEIDTIVAS